MSRIRLWDENWECLYDSETSDLTPEEFMADHDWLNFREDWDTDTRITGRLVKEHGKVQRRTDAAYLTKVMMTPNPLLAREYEFDDPSPWRLSPAPEPFPRPNPVDAINRTVSLQWQAESREAWERAEKVIFSAIVPQLRALGEAIANAKPHLDALTRALDDDQPAPPRADGKPHPPRPSHRPPMWAHDPTRSRRKR